jgi:hypothetical protein
MKIKEVKAFMSLDGKLWNNEADAIHANIWYIIDKNIDPNNEQETTIYEDIENWFRNYPDEVKYILDNIS